MTTPQAPVPSRTFPSGTNWAPLLVAVGLAIAVAAVGVIPQFRTKQVGPGGQVYSSQGGSGGSNLAGGAGGPGGGSGSGGYVAGSNGSYVGGSGGGSGGSGAGPGGSYVAGSNGSYAGGANGSRGGLVGGTRGSGGTAGGSGGGAACSAGQNGGSTAPGVSASEIHIATTEVTTGVGSGFLGEAVSGMQAAINQQNAAGGICGRRISLSSINDGWSGPTGETDIQNFIHSGSVFALVGEPDSEGLAEAIDSGTIDQAQIPVVGTDGMLSDQYYDPWVWPVAASTVANMHIAADYAVRTLHAKSFGIVYDTEYKFGKEGATAFSNEVQRLTGHGIPGAGSSSCSGSFCGVSSQSQSYSSEINSFDSACHPCDVVMMLLEPGPMETWMNEESNASSAWYGHLMGGEPLFDDNLGANCSGCGNMTVWTGYNPDVAPFDSSSAVAGFSNALRSVCPSCDPHNEFTEGAYLGTKLFIAAATQVGPDLTRSALQSALDSMSYASGLAATLHWGTSPPRVANDSMSAFSDNYSGSFNGWSYLNTGFIADPAPTSDYAH